MTLKAKFKVTFEVDLLLRDDHTIIGEGEGKIVTPVNDEELLVFLRNALNSYRHMHPTLGITGAEVRWKKV